MNLFLIVLPFMISAVFPEWATAQNHIPAGLQHNLNPYVGSTAPQVTGVPTQTPPPQTYNSPPPVSAHRPVYQPPSVAVAPYSHTPLPTQQAAPAPTYTAPPTPVFRQLVQPVPAQATTVYQPVTPPVQQQVIQTVPVQQVLPTVVTPVVPQVLQAPQAVAAQPPQTQEKLNSSRKQIQNGDQSIVVPSNGDGDIYNFYFKKGPGAQTVVQPSHTKTPQKAAKKEETITAPPQQTTTTKPVEIAKPEEDKKRRFRLSLGPMEFTDSYETFRGYGVDFRYTFEKYLSLQFGLGSVSSEPKNVTAESSATAVIAQNKQVNGIGNSNSFASQGHTSPTGFFALSVTPFKLRAVDRELLAISGLLGFNYLESRFTKTELEAAGLEGRDNFNGFVGAEIELFLGNVSLAVSTRVDPKTMYGSNQLIAGYRF